MSLWLESWKKLNTSQCKTTESVDMWSSMSHSTSFLKKKTEQIYVHRLLGLFFYMADGEVTAASFCHLPTGTAQLLPLVVAGQLTELPAELSAASSQSSSSWWWHYSPHCDTSFSLTINTAFHRNPWEILAAFSMAAEDPAHISWEVPVFCTSVTTLLTTLYWYGQRKMLVWVGNMCDVVRWFLDWPQDDTIAGRAVFL
jgi:hypothetical protein